MTLETQNAGNKEVLAGMGTTPAVMFVAAMAQLALALMALVVGLSVAPSCGMLMAVLVLLSLPATTGSALLGLRKARCASAGSPDLRPALGLITFAVVINLVLILCLFVFDILMWFVH